MRTVLHTCALGLLLTTGVNAHGDESQAVIEALRARLESLEQEQAALKAQLEALDRKPEPAPATTATPAVPTHSAAPADASAFNPGISVILNGKLTNYSRDPDDYALPGFQLGGEAGLDPQGLGLDHSELVFAGNIDDRFYGRLTLALHAEEGNTEVELEEAFIETMALPRGLGLRAGRFYSDIGYLNNKHPHTWDFADAPLVYRGFLGEQYFDDGVQLRWLAPTELFLEAGVEAFRGDSFPAGGAADSGLGAVAGFARVGGDVGTSHSWRAGVSRLQAEAEDRSSGGDHDHGHGGGVEPSAFSGDSDLTIFDFVWKWAPDGNPYRRNFTFQAEYFDRDESGAIAVDDGAEISSYRGAQKGYYVQGVYQFMPRWRAGIRYDRLWSRNNGDNPDVLEEAGLLAQGHDPQRTSLMLDYSRSEYSRIRLQYNRDESGPDIDHQWLLQYIMSLGAHGAHSY